MIIRHSRFGRKSIGSGGSVTTLPDHPHVMLVLYDVCDVLFWGWIVCLVVGNRLLLCFTVFCLWCVLWWILLSAWLHFVVRCILQSCIIYCIMWAVLSTLLYYIHTLSRDDIYSLVFYWDVMSFVVWCDVLHCLAVYPLVLYGEGRIVYSCITYVVLKSLVHHEVYGNSTPQTKVGSLCTFGRG